MILVDTHSHLYDTAFDSDRAEAINRALENNVKIVMLPAIDSQSHDSLFSLTAQFPEICFPMMGLHPTSVNDNPDFRNELSLVEKYLASPPSPIRKFYAVGEIGLDLYWSKDYLREQIEVFEKQVELALQYDLPIVVHTRSAWQEMVEVLSNYKGRGLKGILHAFSGSYSHYKRLKEFGDFLFGIGGVVTYKNSDVAELVEQIPLQDIVLETDCPYLTPVPFRGKRNESAYIKYICEKVAEIKGISIEETAKVTSQNAIRIFGLDAMKPHE